MARPHENLEAWKEAMRLVKLTYVATQAFPAVEQYGLTSQMRRAAIAVPSNLAEGAARTTRKEFAYFIGVSKGSLSELETQYLIAADLGYLERGHEAFGLIERLARLIAGLHRKVSPPAVREQRD